MKLFTVYLILLSIFFYTVGVPAEEDPANNKSHDKVSGTAIFNATAHNVNMINLYVRSDGQIGRNPISGGGGGHFPWVETNNIEVTFAEGIIWGGILQGAGSPELRVGGQTYAVGTLPGWIITPGDSINPPIVIDPNNPRARVYRRRPDYQTLTVNDEQVRRDAGQQLGIDWTQVTDSDAQDILDQYARDWIEWPVDLGAPFYDVNNNGLFEFGTWIDLDNDGIRDRGEVEEPGLQLADMITFLVCNDTDPVATGNLYGSPPIGLELQITLWAYNNAGPLNNVIYKRYRVFNKSGFNINEMYFSQWVDPDIGQFTNDFSGCDTVLDAGFSYNGGPVDQIFDQFNLPPAAAGYTLLQGPVIPSPGDTAIIDFQEVPNFRNLGMSSFAFFAAGSPVADPPLQDYNGTLAWFNMLRGFTPTFNLNNPIPYITGSGPEAGQPTMFPLSGDPFTGRGDIDGRGTNLPPGDRRNVIVSGPFNFANGEMQEFVVALVGGINSQGSYLSSFEQMRGNIRTVRNLYGKLPRIPQTAFQTSHPNGLQTEIFVQAGLQNFDNPTVCQVILQDLSGVDSDIVFQLFDDGQHGDGSAGDGLWANTMTETNRQFQYSGDVIVTSNSGTEQYSGFLNNVRLRPLPELNNFTVDWENALQDSAINNGERIHLSFNIRNVDQVNPIDNIHIINSSTPADRSLQEIIYDLQIAAGETAVNVSFFLDLLAPTSGDSIDFSYSIIFDQNSGSVNRSLALQQWGPPNNWGDTLLVIPIRGVHNNLLPIVADPMRLTGDIYEVTFSAGIDSTDLRWQLFNRNENIILLSDQPIANEIDFRHPVVDGIIWLTKNNNENPDFSRFETVANGAGALDPPDGAAAGFAGFPSENPTLSQQVGEGRWLIHTGDNGNRGSYEAFLNRISRENTKWNLIIPSDYEIRFTATGSVTIDWFQNGDVFNVPFELWNIGINTPDDPSDDYRMIPVVLDWDQDQEFDFIDFEDHSVSSNTNDPLTDWFYWYNPIDTSPGEGGYLAEENIILTDPASWVREYNREVMSRFVLVNWNGGETTTNGPYNQLMPEEGTVFRITTVKSNFPGDTLLINSPISGIDLTVPSIFALEPNFPNPFNPKTDIRYQIANIRSVELVVYDVLGRKVKTLVNKKQQPGSYQVSWEGRNDAGQRVASGLYFYRLTAGDFVKTRKMILIR